MSHGWLVRRSFTIYPHVRITFTVDEPVPEAIARYSPPATAHVRYRGGGKGNQQWREHVATIGQRLRVETMEGQMAILPREDGRTFSNQWPLMTSDGVAAGEATGTLRGRGGR